MQFYERKIQEGGKVVMQLVEGYNAVVGKALGAVGKKVIM
jgi:hypothetical protein